MKKTEKQIAYRRMDARYPASQQQHGYEETRIIFSRTERKLFIYLMRLSSITMQIVIFLVQTEIEIYLFIFIYYHKSSPKKIFKDIFHGEENNPRKRV